jgi:hypothetical protein
MAKYSVYIPEQTIIVDGDLLDGDPLMYWEEHYRSLIMWDTQRRVLSGRLHDQPHQRLGRHGR